MPRFVDASVFVHAYLRPRRELKPHERRIKARARAIVSRVNEGEAVVTSAVHFSEVANVLEDWIGLDAAQAVQRGLCVRETVEVLPVARGDLLEALSTATEVGVGMTDALAAVLMRDRGIREIYSFDRDFDRFEDIRRFTE
ncbi:MAG: type II toxin-antitoxin system VapC family toxin [Candidatus Thermoplasmatota archaeon]